MVATRRLVKARSRAGDVSSAVHQLNDEVLLIICDLLNVSSRKSLLCASLVCTRWHILAQRVLDATIGPLTLGVKQQYTNDRLFRRLRRDEGFQRRVKNIIVADWFVEPTDHYDIGHGPLVPLQSPYESTCYFSEDWSPLQQCNTSAYTQLQGLAKALKCVCLACFTWSAVACLPHELASALSMQQHCNVKILRNEAALQDAERGSYSPYLNPSTIDSLEMFENLSTLEVMIPAADEHLSHRLGCFTRRARSLRKLAVYATSCMWPMPSKPLSLPGAFGQSTILAFPRLFSLPGGCPPSPIRLSSLELVNVCICSYSGNTAELLNVIEWQNMQDLRLTCSGLLQSVQNRLVNLKKLSIELGLGQPHEAALCTSVIAAFDLEAALQQARRLTYFELTNGRELVTPRTVASLPRSIRNLLIRQNCTGSTHPYTQINTWLGPRLIRLLAQSLPHLETFSLNMPTAEQEFLGYLNFIAAEMPHLRSLTAFRNFEPIMDGLTGYRGWIRARYVPNIYREHLYLKMPNLRTFGICLTPLPPFDRDLGYVEYGQLWERRLQRSYVVDCAKVDMEDDMDLSCVRCVEHDNTARAVDGGVEHLRPLLPFLHRLSFFAY